jgi:hypothetical protein
LLAIGRDNGFGLKFPSDATPDFAGHAAATAVNALFAKVLDLVHASVDDAFETGRAEDAVRTQQGERLRNPSNVTARPASERIADRGSTNARWFKCVFNALRRITGSPGTNSRVVSGAVTAALRFGALFATVDHRRALAAGDTLAAGCGVVALSRACAVDEQARRAAGRIEVAAVRNLLILAFPQHLAA